MLVEQYLRPRSVEETVEMLSEFGEDAKLVAGGQSVMVLLHEGLISPRVLISLSGVTELGGITTDGQASIGALATHTQVLTHAGIRASWPVLAEAEQTVSSTQIRNRGTLCGNLAHAYPTADPPAALLALDAVLTLRSSRGTRQVPAGDFALGPLTTVLEPDELVAAVSLPPQPAGAGTSVSLSTGRPTGQYGLQRLSNCSRVRRRPGLPTCGRRPPVPPPARASRSMKCLKAVRTGGRWYGSMSAARWKGHGHDHQGVRLQLRPGGELRLVGAGCRRCDDEVHLVGERSLRLPRR